MKYQLVFQFSADGIDDYDAMIRVEDMLIDSLGRVGLVDGHDFGAGEMNIFILTNWPRWSFRRAKRVLSGSALPAPKVAYRRIDGESYVWLQPKSSSEDFTVA